MFWVRVCCCVLVCFERVDWAAVGARIWALSSNGRAPASHAGGRGIDTPSVHFLPTRNTFYDRQIFHALPSPRLPLTLSQAHTRTLESPPTLAAPSWRAATSVCQLGAAGQGSTRPTNRAIQREADTATSNDDCAWSSYRWSSSTHWDRSLQPDKTGALSCDGVRGRLICLGSTPLVVKNVSFAIPCLWIFAGTCDRLRIETWSAPLAGLCGEREQSYTRVQLFSKKSECSMG
jgi:hypothetical protein